MLSNFLYNADGVGSQCHSACLEFHNERVYATWYGYHENEYEKGQICFSEYDVKTNKWEKAINAFPSLLNRNCGNPVLLSDPENKCLHLFFVILQRHYWDSAQIYQASLKDGETVWSIPTKVDIPVGTMVRHRPAYRKAGTILIPAYDEKLNQTKIYESSTPFTKWRLLSSIEGELIQGDLLNYGNKEWQIFLRPAGDTPLYIYRALSPDDGRNFTTVLKTTLNCPLSGLAAIRLKSGDTLVCSNHTEKFQRTPISLSIGKKGAVGFKKIADIDGGPLELSYPNMLELKDGTIHIVYTYNRKMIKHIILDDASMREYGI